MSMAQQQGQTVMSESPLVGHHHLILGGRRSGKSVYAEKLALNSGLQPIYVATGQAFDSEMAARIDVHKARRGAQWQCIESPLNIVESLGQLNLSGQIILVDCLTLWLNNLMAQKRDVDVEIQKLISILEAMRCDIIFVSNEVGLSIIPENKLARQFADAQGQLNQAMAQSCQTVTFVAAGLPLQLK